MSKERCIGQCLRMAHRQPERPFMSTGRTSWSLQQRDYGAAQKTGRHASLWGYKGRCTAKSSVLFSLARLPPPKQ